ncbi:hypothetical protein GJ496_002292 [Pomphorhynchus laevis]|nr:hypothetical protein GJ496_002292 [Pomphorhynchus laevis]
MLENPIVHVQQYRCVGAIKAFKKNANNTATTAAKKMKSSNNFSPFDDQSRLSVSPAAIGRTPSGSFTSAIRFAPHKYLATDSCPPPPKRVFTRDVIRCKNDPDKSDVSKSCKCSGRSPRQLDADVEGNEKMAALTRLQSTIKELT